MTDDAILPGSAWSLSARWVFPVSGPPLSDGIVTIAGERIVAVEPRGRRPDVNLGAVAVLPGLVNAHTHLDLTGLRDRCTPSLDFTGWLRAVIAYRFTLSAEQIATNVRTGLAESLRHGTTLVGDIAAGGISWPILAEAPLRSVVFYELLGLTQPRAEAALLAAKRWLDEHPANDVCRPGLSPHAPYSVRRTLFADAARLADEAKYPLSIHLAESREELELLQRRSGAFVDFLKQLDVWDAEGLAADLDEVIHGCDPAPSALFIHGNYLDPTTLIAGKDSVVYCPRTHAAFGHPAHPFRQLLARGVRVALGTDSLASNPDLSVLSEVRYLYEHYPDVPGEVLLRMATLSGAESLGWARETGSLEAVKSADLVVVPLAPGESRDPHELVFASDLPVQRVMYRGQWIESH